MIFREGMGTGTEERPRTRSDLREQMEARGPCAPHFRGCSDWHAREGATRAELDGALEQPGRVAAGRNRPQHSPSVFSLLHIYRTPIPGLWTARFERSQAPGLEAGVGQGKVGAAWACEMARGSLQEQAWLETAQGSQPSGA